MLCRLPKRITKAASDGVNYVEYIRTSGTQYFNTDYIPNAKTRIVLDVVWDGTVTKCLFGTRNAASNTDTYNNSLWIMTDGLPRCDYYGTSLKGTEAVPTTRTTVERNANVTTINGTSITNTASTNTSQYPLFLFAMNTAGTAEKIGTFDCYQNGIQIYDDGVTLTHDYRPAIDPDGIVCLYDRVTKTYLYMSGSGTLEAGASISGGSSDMTVTIAGTSTVPNGIVTINGTAYSSDQMVNITAGTSIAVYLGNDTDENCYIYLDGTQVDSGDPAEYTFVAANSVTITFSSYGEVRKCHITTESADSEPTGPFAVTMTGSSWADGSCYVQYENAQHMSAGTFEVPAKDTIAIYISSGTITLNGTTVQSGGGTYTLTVTSNTTINSSRSSGAYAITITTE